MVLLETVLAGILHMSCPDEKNISEYMSKSQPAYTLHDLNAYHKKLSGPGHLFLMNYYDYGKNGFDIGDRLSIIDMRNGNTYDFNGNKQGCDILREIKEFLD